MGAIEGSWGRPPLQNRYFSLMFRQRPSWQICTCPFTVDLDLFTALSHPSSSTPAFLVFLRLRKAHPLHQNFPTGSFATTSFNTHQFGGSLSREHWQISHILFPNFKKKHLSSYCGRHFLRIGWKLALLWLRLQKWYISTSPNILIIFQLPRCRESDNGLAFISQVTQLVSRALASSSSLLPLVLRKVEKANRCIKTHWQKFFWTSLSLEGNLTLLPRKHGRPQHPIPLSFLE